jgi:hypothetical protein
MQLAGSDGANAQQSPKRVIFNFLLFRGTPSKLVVRMNAYISVTIETRLAQFLPIFTDVTNHTFLVRLETPYQKTQMPL